MQLYAVNFISLLSSLYMFRVAHTPIIRSTTVSTATGTIILLAFQETYPTKTAKTTLFFLRLGVLIASDSTHLR